MSAFAIFYAVKTPKGEILLYTVSERQGDARSKFLALGRGKDWAVYKREGYKIIRGRFVEDA